MTVAQDWARRRTHHHAEFSPGLLAERRSESVSVCLPAKEVAATIEPIVRDLVRLRERGVIDHVVVVDAASRDGTAALAERAGAEVHQEAALVREFGAPRGKGDAMWRALSVLRGDVVCYLDADSEAFGPHFACGLLGPLLSDPTVHFVKAFYRRPFRLGEVTLPDGGGRVTELTARPALALFWPELAEVRQPLAGEFAARRELLARIPFATGYAIETQMLLDVYRVVGLDALAQVDLDVRQNRHQTLAALRPMAREVLEAVASRLDAEGRLAGERPELDLVERPPMASVRAAA